MKTRIYKTVDVFTPNAYPRFTYVQRDDVRLEERLRHALATPGEVVSISGPSKSGKTVLVERVVGPECLITVTGAAINSSDHLWNNVLDWMEAPSSLSTSTRNDSGGSVGANAGGGFNLFGVFKSDVGGSSTLSSSTGNTNSETRTRRGMQQVIEETAGSDFVILIDDFHYMERDVQVDVAKQIKEAARQGVKICTASVPHRADDVVRSNPELRGRVNSLDLNYWSAVDLLQIPQAGFKLLGDGIQFDWLKTHVQECSGSPQLMQAICLQACFYFHVEETPTDGVTKTADDGAWESILTMTSSRTDYSSLVVHCHRGPKTRGTERKEYRFVDDSKGDVYRAVLLAIASDPPKLSLDYNEISNRIARVCKEECPPASSIYQTSAQISRIARNMYPDQRVIEWDDDVLEIVDPYLLYYMRWSEKLSQLTTV